MSQLSNSDLTTPDKVGEARKSTKRLHEHATPKQDRCETNLEVQQTEPIKKCVKLDIESMSVYHDKNKLVPKHILAKMTPNDIDLLQNVTTTCTDLARVKAAIQLRKKHRLCLRLPDDVTDSLYYIENSLRKVYPYNFMFQSFTRGRWLGKKLKDVIRQEFRDITEFDLRQKFESNRILVDGETASYDHVLRENTLITSFVHRHELPVLAAPLKIIFEDRQTLVIDKPPSVPIHPCGRFNHNSVSKLLENEHKYSHIKNVHRLDRLVSGVLIMAKNSDRARQFETEISNRGVMKEYVCRVDGEFPSGDATDDGWMTINQPLYHLPGKISVMIVHPYGKSSTTKFKRLSYNGKSSVVLCQPLTGRMHQIRVHLQYLGYPISNDSLYNDDVFGPERGKGGRLDKTHEQLLKAILDLHQSNTWLISDGVDIGCTSHDSYTRERFHNKTAKFLNSDEREETLAALGHYFKGQTYDQLEQQLKFEESKMHLIDTCDDCQNKFYDPPLRRLYMYLHAFRYSGTGWCFESEMPVWARDDWKY